MTYTYKNIIGAVSEKLLDYSDLYNKTIKCINICNVSSSRVTVDLYLYKIPTSIHSRSYDDHADRDNETITNLSYYIIKNFLLFYSIV